jgi:hypothetical protein
MPSQETFASARLGDALIQVIKTYDEGFAREAFNQMDEVAIRFLGESLVPNSASIVEPISASDGTDALWEEIQDGAREDWNTFSYFVVAETSQNGISKYLFVSSDWPTAERFMQHKLGAPTPADVF